MKSTHKSNSTSLGIAAVLLGCIPFAISCAPELPNILRDARASYSAAEQGPAGKLTPAELVDAKQALNAAEASFEADGASQETLDAAYIAERRAKIADAHGQTALALANAKSGTDELVKIRAAHLSDVEGELSQSQDKVARTSEQLAAEQAARSESEARLRDAMSKLALAASLAVKEEPRGTVITLPGNVLFATGKSELLAGAKSKLDAVAIALKEQPDTTITVEGHTDSQGTPESNVSLSDRRAASVLEYLRSQGVPSGQLVAKGLGETKPVGDNNTTDGRSQNRRVEIIITPREKR